MARPTIGATTQSETATSTTHTATLPSHSEGDLLVVSAFITRADTTMTINESYTALFAVQGITDTRSLCFRAFAKVAGASETAPVITAGVSTGSHIAFVTAFGGATDTVGDIQTSTAIAAGVDNDPNWASMTVDEDDSVAFRYAVASDDNQAVSEPSVPAGHTSRGFGENSGGTAGWGLLSVDADTTTLSAATWTGLWGSFAVDEVEGLVTIVIPPASGNDASGTPSITKPTSGGASHIWPRVYLNTSQTKSGATEMTVTASNAAGTSATFTDPEGAPTGALFLGVERQSDDDIGWIAVTVNSGETASGSPSIVKPTSSGTSEIIKPASGTPSITKPTSSGTAEIIKPASGSPSITKPTSTGTAEIEKQASGSPSIVKPTSAGAAVLVRLASGSPSTTKPTSSGAATIEKPASGASSITKPTSTGTLVVTSFASGTPSITKPTSTGNAINCSEKLSPDTIALQTNLLGVVTDIDESPDTPDGNWLVLD